jgi:hypothetical protein
MYLSVMDMFTHNLEASVNAITNVDDLLNFATTWGIQDSTIVRFRMYQLQNPYQTDFVDALLDGNLDQDTEDALEIGYQYVLRQTEIGDIIQNNLSRGSNVQTGSGSTNDVESAVSGPSTQSKQPTIPYTFRKKSERTFANNAAIESVYVVKIDEQHQGRKLRTIQEDLHGMFDTILDTARGELAGNDLGRVIVHHDGLHDPIVIPLKTWDRLNSDVVLETIEKVLNSHQELAVNHSFEITIGSIELPKGAGVRLPITRLHGDNNSIDLKHSIISIDNTNDSLCMSRAIGVLWAKINRCSKEEWQEITRERRGNNNLQLILEHKKVPLTHYDALLNKNRKEQKNLAAAICKLAGVPTDRPASIDDIQAFENVLDVRIMVVSSRLGNRFVTSPATEHPERPCIYLYLTRDDHYHAIASITGFFCSGYFCKKCLKHYNNVERHRCEITCIVCKSDQCPVTESPRDCSECNMTCRSEVCFQRHKAPPTFKNGKKKGQVRGLTPCKKWWKCPTCYKVLNREKRKIDQHDCGEHYCKSCQQYVLEDHLCFLRTAPHKENEPRFIFFDFECRQEDILQCAEGYLPLKTPMCNKCRGDTLCNDCSKCKRCSQSCCG